MRWIVYETTNLINGRKYRGVHCQKTEEFDGYLGTGRLIRAAIRKHGRAAFSRETLFEFDSEAEAYEKERELVTLEWIADENTYNLCEGGVGGMRGMSHTDEARQKIADAKVGVPRSPETRQRISESLRGRDMSDELERRRKISEAAKRRVMPPDVCKRISESLTGRRLSEEHKRRIGESNKRRNAARKDNHKRDNKCRP